MLDECGARGVEVRYGAHVVGIEDGGSGGPGVVILEDDAKVLASCIVGGDGVHSRVRRAMWPHLALETVGVCIRGAAEDTGVLRELAGLPSDSTMPLAISLAAQPGHGLSMNIWGGRVSYCYDFYLPEDQYHADINCRELLRERTEGYHPMLRKFLVEDTNEEDYYLERLRDLGAWGGPLGRGCVTLIGDAAHPKWPAGGGNTAVFDGIAVADAIAGAWIHGHTAIRLALRAYEAEACSRVSPEMVLEGRTRLKGRITEAAKERFAEDQRTRPEKWRAQQEQKKQASEKIHHAVLCNCFNRNTTSWAVRSRL